jgi:His/Glu/Gln/Arg/opine family amino acid ABC transporter permease subunit
VLAFLPDWVDPTVHYILHVGVPGTLRIAIASVIASSVIGVVLGTLLTIRFLPSRALIRLYIEVWRGLPLIVTILMVYFVAPTLGSQFQFDALTAATIGLSLWGSAQVAEATRGAVQSIPREQHEAASALGFRWVGRHVHVILPQALRRLMPPMVTLLVGIIQNSTLAAVIGASEILGTAQRQIERLNAPVPIGEGNGHSFAILAGVAAAFFLISFPLTRLASYLEKRLV